MVSGRWHRHIFISKKIAALINDTLDYIFKKEKEGFVFVFRPDEAPSVSRVEKDSIKLQAAYGLGHKAGEEKLEDLKAFLLMSEK